MVNVVYRLYFLPAAIVLVSPNFIEVLPKKSAGRPILRESPPSLVAADSSQDSCSAFLNSFNCGVGLARHPDSGHSASSYAPAFLLQLPMFLFCF